MDRYFIAYKLGEAHRKAALEAKSKTQQPNPQSNPQSNPQPKPQPSKSSNNQDEKLFEDYVTEWMYKTINNF